MPTATYLPYTGTGYFSKTITDYLTGTGALRPFYRFSPYSDSLKAAIEARSVAPVDRETLVQVLRKQYSNLPQHDAATDSIHLLLQENTFTVCTAHQPNLATGYLYFIYKILHAVRLAADLAKLYPDKHFVPVYYIGSEDNDLEELGTFRYEGKKFVWDADGQTGAVGRMKTASLKPLLDDFFNIAGPPGDYLKELKQMLTVAYLQHNTVAEATQYLVHQLFGKYGLVVLDPDDALLKRNFLPVMKDDLLRHAAHEKAVQSIAAFEAAGYKAQVYPREINLFYLKDNLRERIETEAGKWRVLNTTIEWNEQELLSELDAHPERFSPNVILRPLYQETILPNVAFIGGGSEVAYWLQLRAVFDEYQVFYPAIHLRQSALWMDEKATALRHKMRLSVASLFAPEDALVRQVVSRHSTAHWQMNGEAELFEAGMEAIRTKAAAIDITLEKSTQAVLHKIKYQLHVMEQKMLRAEKRKMQTQLDQLKRLREMIFPNGSLQERTDNFSALYLQYGAAFFDVLLTEMQPLNPHFMVIEN